MTTAAEPLSVAQGGTMSDPARLSRSAVNSHNEWDPLEEIIVSDANRREMLFTTGKPAGEGDGGPTGSVP
jgi:hypothetical protein